MKILAIETSCDETAIAIIEAKGGFKKPSFKVLANVISSQVKLHRKFGGVVPFLAKREHQRNLVSVLKSALEEAGLLKVQDFNLSELNFGTKFNPERLIPNSKLKILDSIFSHEPDLCLDLCKSVSYTHLTLPTTPYV